VIDSDVSSPPNSGWVFVPRDLEIPAGVDLSAMASGYSLNVYNCSVS